MDILNGKEIARNILNDIALKIRALGEQGKRIPRIDMILVGNDYASQKYVRLKQVVAKEIGVMGWVHRMPESVSTLDVVNLVDTLNKDETVDGFMIQLPLPSHIDRALVLKSIDPKKDVDGLTPTNLGKLFQKDSTAIPSATPLGIITLLDAYNIKLLGKRVVVLGSSAIVGKPLTAMMLERSATVTICNSKTVEIADVAREADILVSAVGKPLFVKENFVKKGCVLVDVGSNKHPESGKLVGDVDMDSVQGIPSYITPVPGGVGPMTLASLMLNLMRCYENGRR